MTARRDGQLEDHFQQQVVELAHYTGWKIAHFRHARTKYGWTTPAGVDGKGWPDLVLVRDRILFRELKRDGGKLSPEQLQWLLDLEAAGQDARVWTPADWDDIQATLTRRRGT